MNDVRWYELFQPRGMTLDTVTAFLRPLASRPRIGLRSTTPIVVFEQWASGGDVRYLMGVERPQDSALVEQLTAAVPGLTSIELATPPRESLRYGCEIRLTSVAASLRTDVAVDVAVAQSAALVQATDGVLVVQWVIGPAQSRRQRPTPFRPLIQLGFTASPTPSAHDQTLWRQKTTEPLFAIRGRIGTTGSMATLRPLRGAIQQADSATGHLVIGPPSPRAANRIIRLNRSRWGGIVNGRELAALLAWPPLTAANIVTAYRLGTRHRHRPTTAGRSVSACTQWVSDRQPSCRKLRSAETCTSSVRPAAASQT